MEWTESLTKAIEYMETHMLEPIETAEIARAAKIPSLYLQKGFKIMTGYTLGEYVRYRRLYLAAVDLLTNGDKVIDLALRYGYETPESFTKAFTRFHGISPVQLKKNTQKVRNFHPLKVKVSIEGGENLPCTIEEMEAFRLIGMPFRCPIEQSFELIPKFWNDFKKQAIDNTNIGEYGVCIDEENGSRECLYLIAGRFLEKEIPKGMMVYEVPKMMWAKFPCIGPMPGAMQAVYMSIFGEWFSGYPRYEMAMNVNLEWYEKGDTSRSDYRSEIWIPVRESKSC